MAYISFEMGPTLAMVYILAKMQLALHVPLETLTMASILLEMCLTPLMFFLEP
jgi:hypothetical protein